MFQNSQVLWGMVFVGAFVVLANSNVQIPMHLFSICPWEQLVRILLKVIVILFAPRTILQRRRFHTEKPEQAQFLGNVPVDIFDYLLVSSGNVRLPGQVR